MKKDNDTEGGLELKDANGNIIRNGDTVTVIRDVKVKGSPTGLKQGTKIKNIRLSDEVEGVTGKIEGMKGIYIKPELVKKA